MKQELELSIIAGSEEAQLLSQLGLKAQFVLMNWDDAWRDVLNIGLFKHGADVSEIGAPWTSTIPSMDVLRPFARREIAAMGGAAAFSPANWQTTHLHDEPEVWAMPFLADVTVIYYWRDMLESAGIDAQTAFQTPDRLADTLNKLKAHGIDWPWSVDAIYHWATLHNIVSWIWQAGGDLLNPAGKQPAFDSPEALAGMKAYFALHPYLAPEGRQPASHMNCVDLFMQRKAAVGMGSCNWLYRARQTLKEHPDLLEKIGAACSPGTPYVGGMNLVVWKHTRQADAAVALIQQLTGKAVQHAYSQRLGSLPVRLEVLNEPPFTTDPRLKVMVESLRMGRTYPTVHGFGLVEERLSRTFIQVWTEIFSDPQADSDAIVERNVTVLAQRLRMTLQQFD